MSTPKSPTTNTTATSTPNGAPPPSPSPPDMLFSPTWISPSVSAALPQGYTMRPLKRSDYDRGFLDVLRVMTVIGDVTKEEFEGNFDHMKSREGDYYILVILDGEEKIVGTGAIVIEQKFIHHLGRVGHIEDIAVTRDQQGKKLGLRIIHALDYIADQLGCYKSILDCAEANEGFYVKCGYKRKGVQMAHYFEDRN